MSKIIDNLIAYHGSLRGDTFNFITSLKFFKGSLPKNNDFTHVNFESPYAISFIVFFCMCFYNPAAFFLGS